MRDQVAVLALVLSSTAVEKALYDVTPRANGWASGALGLLWTFTLFFYVLQNLGDPSAFILAVMFLVSLLVLRHVRKWPTPAKTASVTHEGPAVRR